jgi:hypothetical protein
MSQIPTPVRDQQATRTKGMKNASTKGLSGRVGVRSQNRFLGFSGSQ